MTTLYEKILKVAEGHPETRELLVPLLREAATPRTTRQNVGGLTFDVIDMRGQKSFPTDETGFVYQYRGKVSAVDPYTGDVKVKPAHFLIRTDARSRGKWRIDKMDLTIAEAVTELRDYYPTPEAAAKALKGYLSGLGKVR